MQKIDEFLFFPHKMYKFYHILLNVIKENRYFLIPYSFFLLVTSFLLIFFSKTQIHLAINQYNCQAMDFFFKYLTFLGDGLFVVFLFFGLCCYRYRYAIFILASFLISGLIVQLLKRFVFGHSDRPGIFFAGIYKLHLVDGVSMLGSYSFPSGHSATAFGTFLGLSIISQNKFLKLSFFFISLLIAFSRVYLSQHFLGDIFAGSIIGTLVTLMLFPFFKDVQASWMDKSFKSILKTSK